MTIHATKRKLFLKSQALNYSLRPYIVCIIQGKSEKLQGEDYNDEEVVLVAEKLKVEFFCVISVWHSGI